MAKSIRSKHRRRMRSVKREKFDKKIVAKLKETVSKDVLNNPDVDMSDIVTVKTATELKDQQSTSKQDGYVEIEGSASKSFNKKTKKDEHGQYPAWMNQRAMRKQQTKNKKIKKKGKKASAW
ncbi:protein LLP-like [Babylonia areolata]|uniref:protein LLP-like n=1 Tax=Babylonia areolata TaxID=304850 RepID=UPI003FD3A664